MTKATFRYLCNRLHERIHRLHTRLRLAISVEQRVAVTLWRLSTNCEYRTISHLFGVGRSTVCEIFRETCHVICEVLLSEVIKLPSQHNIQVGRILSSLEMFDTLDRKTIMFSETDQWPTSNVRHRVIDAIFRYSNRHTSVPDIGYNDY